MSELKPQTQENSGNLLRASNKNKNARADRKTWKNKLKRQQRRHKMR